MTVQERVVATMMAPEQKTLEEGAMVHKERWEEVRRRYFQERNAIAEIARGLDMDRKTVRRCVREEQWQPYQRVRGGPMLLSGHEEYLRQRAEEVGYSAQILYQELRARGYRGSYETVKLFVRPLRTRASSAEQTLKRFETAPGHQSQIDWGQARVYFGGRGVTVHLFVLTLGYSRRSFYRAYPNEQLGAFLEAHEGAFEHFGGHTREHLYDRTRTVCRPGESGRASWNVTFLAFAEYWGFEPRLCQPYRARTKGKVESGVKYVKRNFLPGRHFRDQSDFDAQLSEWTATVADVRLHGTTHERPIDRFERERAQLIACAGQPGFRLECPVARIVASDYLVSVDTNHYSVPFGLIGETVEVKRQGEHLHILYQGEEVATHARLTGKHQLCVLPEHGPGAIARNARLRYSSAGASAPRGVDNAEVEVRDLSVYEQLLERVGLEVMP